MGELVLPGDVRVALTHTAAYGLAAILEDAGVTGVTVAWTMSLDARPIVAAPACDAQEMARIVHAHAAGRAEADAWPAAVSTIAGSTVGRLSPRVKAPADDAAWRAFVAERRQSIDREVAAVRWLDLAFIAALGEPAYWRHDRSGARRPDEGASRWEMKTRNRGEDFVQHRLRGLAQAVKARGDVQVLDGLCGRRVEDEAGGNSSDSRSATGLAAPGPIDNALAWCGLWGLSLLPVVHRLPGPSATAGHGVGRAPDGSRQAWFSLPVMTQPLRLARLASVLVSEELAAAAVPPEVGSTTAGGLATRSAQRWLIERGLGGLVRFPIAVFGSASAPERRALLGTVIRFVS